jgi:Tfp pilus assembly protein PilP
MIMKLTKSLIIAMLASGTLWAQGGPTNQVISNAKSLVNSAGQAPSTSAAQPAAKPGTTSAKPVAVTPKPAVKAPAPVNAKPAAPAAATKPAPAAPAAATKPAPANPAAATKPAPATATKPVAHAPAAAAKAAPAAAKAVTNAAPSKKPLVAEGKKQPVAKAEPKPEAKPADNPSAVAKPALAKESTASRVSSTAGKRDPFVSPIVRASAGGPACETGKRCLMVDQILLKGIVKAPSGFIAVVENPMKRAYFLRENDPVFNGSVIKITDDSVVFREATTDKLGKQSMREVVKKVNAPVV